MYTHVSISVCRPNPASSSHSPGRSNFIESAKGNINSSSLSRTHAELPDAALTSQSPER